VPHVAIVTDASIDLPEAVAREAGLVVAPLGYDVGGHHYLTGEQTAADFYAALAHGNALVEGVSADDYEAAMRKAADSASEVICVSQSLGSTFSRVSAEVAIRRLQVDGKQVRLISPGRSTAGLGALCLAAARRAAQDATADEVFKFLEDASLSTDTYAIPGSLDYLERTGELALLSSQSSVGPVETGAPVFRVRGRVSAAAPTADHAAAEAEVVNRVERAANGRPVILVVAHALAGEAAERLAAAARARLTVCELHVSEMGPALGAVLGPGSYSLGYCAVDAC
jgi:DegV family protein with EDD domain